MWLLLYKSGGICLLENTQDWKQITLVPQRQKCQGKLNNNIFFFL